MQLIILHITHCIQSLLNEVLIATESNQSVPGKSI